MLPAPQIGPGVRASRGGAGQCSQCSFVSALLRSVLPGRGDRRGYAAGGVPSIAEQSSPRAGRAAVCSSSARRSGLRRRGAAEGRLLRATRGCWPHPAEKK